MITDTGINPASTESDMRAFFDKLATQFVSLSDQSRQLSDLTSRFNSLESRFNDLSAENDRLKSEIHATVAQRDNLQTELNTARQEIADTHKLANEYSAERDAARADADSWRARHSVLNDDHQATIADLNKASNELFNTRQSLNQANIQIQALEAKVKALTDHAADLEQDLHSIRSVFDKVKSPPPVVQEVGEAPSENAYAPSNPVPAQAYAGGDTSY